MLRHPHTWIFAHPGLHAPPGQARLEDIGDLVRERRQLGQAPGSFEAAKVSHFLTGIFFFCSQTSNLLLCLPTNGAISLLQPTLDTLEHHFNVTGVIVPNSCTREVEKNI